ncbi:transporter substrate-binding domain-containing protein [Streptococcus pneumoniae]
MKKITLVCLAILLTLISLLTPTAGAEELGKHVKEIQKRGVLNVGVKQDVPNFGFLDPETKTYTGLEVDLARKIADDLKVKVNFVPVSAQTRGPLLDNEQVDLVLATFTITDERKKLFNFTTPYYTDASGFLVNKDSQIASIHDLNGKTIGVAQGAIQGKVLTEIAKKHGWNFRFVELGSYPELSLALRAHRIDAFSVDKSILSGYLNRSNTLLQDGFKSADYGVVSKKSKEDLNHYVDSLIKKWSKDGTLKKIYKTYHLEPSKATKD